MTTTDRTDHQHRRPPRAVAPRSSAWPDPALPPARMLADAGADVTAYDRPARGSELAGRGRQPRRPADRAGPGGRSEPEVARPPRPRADLVDHQPVASRPRFPTTDAWLRDALRQAEAARSAGHRRGRALPAPDAGAGAGRDRHQGQDHDHRADRRDPGRRPGCRTSVGGNIGSRLIKHLDGLSQGRLGGGGALRAAAADHLARCRRGGLHQHRLRPSRSPWQR